MKLYQKIGLSFGLMTMAVASQAAIDVTAATTALADVETAIGAVGVAMIAAAGLALGYKWIKGFLFS